MIIKCGITGSTGSLGTIFVKKKTSFRFYKFKGDICNKQSLEKWVKKNNFDIFLHFAAIVPIQKVNKNQKKAYRVNYLGTKNIVDSILKFNNNLQWFFFSSTSHVYKSKIGKISENDILKPISFYGLTKLKAERYIKKKFSNKIKYCIGRIFSTTHFHQKSSYFIPVIKKKISQKNKKFLKFYNLNQFRDFISPYDISNIIILLWKKKYQGIVNIGTGKKVLLKDIVLKLLKINNKNNYLFINKKKLTSLVADISKLKSIIKYKIKHSLQDMIFKY